MDHPDMRPLSDRGNIATPHEQKGTTPDIVKQQKFEQLLLRTKEHLEQNVSKIQKAQSLLNKYVETQTSSYQSEHSGRSLFQKAYTNIQQKLEDQRRKTEEITRQQHKYRQILANNPDALFAVDADAFLTEEMNDEHEKSDELSRRADLIQEKMMDMDDAHDKKIQTVRDHLDHLYQQEDAHHEKLIKLQEIIEAHWNKMDAYAQYDILDTEV